MASCRRVLQSIVSCSQRLVVTSSVRPALQSIITKNSITPPQCRVTASSFSTTALNRNESGVVFNVQDKEDFQQRVVKSDVPIVVDFHATWCGPCKTLGPRIQKLVDSKNGKVLLAKVDIDHLSELAIHYGVRAVPTVIAIKDGKKVDEFIGNLDDDVLNSFVNKLCDD